MFDSWIRVILMHGSYNCSVWDSIRVGGLIVLRSNIVLFVAFSEYLYGYVSSGNVVVSTYDADWSHDEFYHLLLNNALCAS